MAEYFKELREKVGKRKILVPGTGAFILNERDEVLLMLRTDNDEWGMPGGFMDLGETVLESLRREAREELGIETRDEELFGIYSGPELDVTHENGDETASVTVLFLIRSYTGELRNSEESRELRFFPLDALPEPLHHTSARFLDDLRRSRGGELALPHIL